MISHVLRKKYDIDYESLADIAKLECISIVNDEYDLWFLENARLLDWLFLKKFVIFGTGGSSLGGQCIHGISNQKEKVTFVSNLYPHTIRNILSEDSIDDTGFLYISKSGDTLEIVSQILLTMEFFKKSGKSISDMRDRIVVITENKPSVLQEIARAHDFFCITHPKEIGGRFSVFSAVGMLPALICGVNPMSLRKGASNYLANFSHLPIDGAHFVVESPHNHVFFIYSDRLVPLGAWLAQLYAESTGKSGVGITPLIAVGSVDQHSQLQLYLGGPQDKSFTFLSEKCETDIRISGEFAPNSLSYIKNKSAGTIFDAQYKATSETIIRHGFPTRKMELQSVTPELLGALFMHFMYEAIVACRLMNVDAFNQPAVEQGKILTKQLLGGT